jgi:hypothetical protein
VEKLGKMLKQPSTWSGTGVIGLILAMYLAPEQVDAILKLGIAVIGAIEVLRDEKK